MGLAMSWHPLLPKNKNYIFSDSPEQAESLIYEKKIKKKKNLVGSGQWVMQCPANPLRPKKKNYIFSDSPEHPESNSVFWIKKFYPFKR